MSAPSDTQAASFPREVTIVALRNSSMSNVNRQCTIGLLQLSNKILAKIFSRLPYQKVAHLRQVCRVFDNICQQILNSSFHSLRHRVLAQFIAVDEQMLPITLEETHTKDSISETLYKLIALLEVVFSKYIEGKHHCFFAGEILDEVNYVLFYIKTVQVWNYSLSVTNELFELVKIAMEFFKEEIESTFPEIVYYDANTIIFDYYTNNNYWDSTGHKCQKSLEGPTSSKISHKLKNRIQKIEENIKEYQEQMSILHYNLRASEIIIARQQMQHTGMDDYKKIHLEMVDNFNILLQQLNECKTELQFWRSNAPMPSLSEVKPDLTKVLSMELNVKRTNSQEAVGLPEMSSNNHKINNEEKI